MSELKATPGPYSMRLSRLNGDVGITAPDVKNVIAECFEDMRFDSEKASEEAMANAHLFIASEDMYEALEMVRDADEDCKRDGLATMPPTARAKIDAALAKAMGEQS